MASRSSSSSPPAASTAQKLLEDAGLRVTPARADVLKVLGAMDRALSHADIEAALPQPMDRVTLYRTLDKLTEAGLLHKTIGEDRVARFASLQHQAAHADHAHFHCDDCGRVYCLAMKLPRKPALPEGFALEGTELTLHGHCADCAGSTAPPRASSTGR